MKKYKIKHPFTESGVKYDEGQIAEFEEQRAKQLGDLIEEIKDKILKDKDVKKK